MKNKQNSICISVILIFTFFLFSSCYTQKKGVVPCPQWGQIEQGQTVSGNLTALAVK